MRATAAQHIGGATGCHDSTCSSFVVNQTAKNLENPSLRLYSQHSIRIIEILSCPTSHFATENMSRSLTISMAYEQLCFQPLLICKQP